VSKVAEQIFAGSPAKAAAAAEKIAGETVDEIEAALPGAIRGDYEQLDLYVHAFRQMAERLLEATQAEKKTLPGAKAMLLGGAINAPFSPWVGVMGPGKGVTLVLVSLLRQTRPDTKPLSSPPQVSLPWEMEDRDVVRFYRGVIDLLEKAELPLERVRRVLGLNRTELAALFGVSRQAVERWEAQGVPSERQAKLATVGAIVDLLEMQLKRDRIEGMVRRPAPAYGDRSILEAIATGEEDLVLAELRAAFDWAGTA